MRILEFFFELISSFFGLFVGLMGSWIFWVALAVFFFTLNDDIIGPDISEGVAKVEVMDCVAGADPCIVSDTASIQVTINAVDKERLLNTKYVKLDGEMIQEESEEDGDEISVVREGSSLKISVGDSNYVIDW